MRNLLLSFTFALSVVSLSAIPDSVFERILAEAILDVTTAGGQTEKLWADIKKSGAGSAQDVLAMHRQPDETSAKMAKSREIFERVLEAVLEWINQNNFLHGTAPREVDVSLLTPEQMERLAQLSGCETHTHTAKFDCSSCFYQKYRTADGSCNNLAEHLQGASHTIFLRLLPPIYENGFNEPVGWNPDQHHNGYLLPSARLVSTKLMRTHKPKQHEKFSLMLMQWGQFLDHDLTFTPQTLSHEAFKSKTLCNDSCVNESPCFPIPVPPDDDRIHRHKCIGVTRSAAACGTGSSSRLVGGNFERQQFNQLTAYIDASQVYGSTQELTNTLRDLVDNRYLFRTGPKSLHGDKYLLPFAPKDEVFCDIDQSRAIPCFHAGDVRATEQLGLLSMQTIWMREHNRLATLLRQLNPEWSDEVVFQEARKVVGAQMQQITFRDWLPKILGPSGLTKLGSYSGYNNLTDATLANEFSTAAMRFGHTLIMPVTFRFDENFNPVASGHLPLHQAFFAPYQLFDQDGGGIDALLRGSFYPGVKMPEPSNIMNSEVIDKLFALAFAISLDLASLNIQRGRDHGIAKYVQLREWCGFGRVTSWDDLAQDIRNPEVLATLQELYGHFDNIDLFPGMTSEELVEGAVVGPTFMCILTNQFKRTRDGDRFWYENPGVFSEAQLAEIRKASLARVICDNSDNIKQVQRDVFLLGQHPSEFVDCSQISGIDLASWRDTCKNCRDFVFTIDRRYFSDQQNFDDYVQPIFSKFVQVLDPCSSVHAAFVEYAAIAKIQYGYRDFISWEAIRKVMTSYQFQDSLAMGSAVHEAFRLTDQKLLRSLNTPTIVFLFVGNNPSDLFKARSSARDVRQRGGNIAVVAFGDSVSVESWREISEYFIKADTSKPTCFDEIIEWMLKITFPTIPHSQPPTTQLPTTTPGGHPLPKSLDPNVVCPKCAGFYANPDDCHTYFHCMPQIGGAYVSILKPCAPGLFWHQQVLSCVREGPTPCSQAIPCLDKVCRAKEKALAPPIPFAIIVDAITCFDEHGTKLQVHSTHPNKYFVIGEDSHYSRACPAGRHFQLSTCRCEASREVQRLKVSVILFLPFENDFDDHSSNRLTTFNHGDAFLNKFVRGAHASSGSLSVCDGANLEIPGLSNVEFYGTASWCLFFRCRHQQCSSGGLLSNQDPSGKFTIVLAVVGDTVAAHLAATGREFLINTGFEPDNAGWTQVCVVYDASSYDRPGSLRLYINGRLAEEKITEEKRLLTSVCSYKIGTDPTFTDFCGHIDNVVISPHAFSTGLVQAHFLGDTEPL